jgi:hypothetical protein
MFKKYLLFRSNFVKQIRLALHETVLYNTHINVLYRNIPGRKNKSIGNLPMIPNTLVGIQAGSL